MRWVRGLQSPAHILAERENHRDYKGCHCSMMQCCESGPGTGLGLGCLIVGKDGGSVLGRG